MPTSNMTILQIKPVWSIRECTVIVKNYPAVITPFHTFLQLLLENKKIMRERKERTSEDTNSKNARKEPK